MEKSKTPQVFHPSQFSSAIFSVTLAICFVALIHVEIELHVHRQMLQVLNHDREDSIELRKVVDRHKKTIDSVLKSGSPTGNNCILIQLNYPSRSTQREYGSKPLKNSIVKRIIVFKR